MNSHVYDVTLYWHDGGSVFLGTVAGTSSASACDAALAKYTAASPGNRKEIEEGGGFHIEAEPLQPTEAIEWRKKHT